MEVRVIAEKWGNYVKGDVIPNMPESTVNAIMKHDGILEIVGEETEVKPKKKH